MKFQRRLGYMMLGGLVALGIAFGGAAAFAQTDGGDEAPVETPLQEGNGAEGPRGNRGDRNGDRAARSEALADALGITVEELETAVSTAKAEMIAQAVADGQLTQEQADDLLASDRGIRGRVSEEALADALGISVEELEAAKLTVRENKLAELVADGTMTQEQADMMLAQQAVESYVDREAVQAAMLDAYETAVSDALADGAITQEQADTLLENAAERFENGGFGGRGFGGGRGHGGPRGFNGGGNGPTDTGLDA